jgi:hypothetical protein
MFPKETGTRGKHSGPAGLVSNMVQQLSKQKVRPSFPYIIPAKTSVLFATGDHVESNGKVSMMESSDVPDG